MALMTYKQALAHLRIPDLPETKPDVLLKMEQATQIVLDYIDRDVNASPVWADDTEPGDDREFASAQAATLIVLMDLWRFRGDDDDHAIDHAIDPDWPGGLNPRAVRLLTRLRKQALG